ncbi:hypothetical protein B0H14DRAFT_2616087 [Mycena olivaceomarginata]|nr:hypothetical protein B0H14DRAFT_2616087 [Mycena olivaceomarginata]
MVNVPVQEIRRHFGALVRPDYTTNVRQQEVIGKFGKLKINFTQLRSYLDGYDAYFMKHGNEYTVRNPAARSQLQDAEQAWHDFIVPSLAARGLGPRPDWALVPLPGLQMVRVAPAPAATPARAPAPARAPLLLARLLLFAAPAPARAPALALAPPPARAAAPAGAGVPGLRIPTPTPLAVSHLSQTFPPPPPLLLARPLIPALVDLLPLVLLHPLMPVYPEFAHPPLPPLAVSHLSQTFPPLLPAPLRVRRLQM